MPGIAGMAMLPFVIIIMIMRDIFCPVEIHPQCAVLHFYMQFAAVYDDTIYCDAFLIALDKGGLDVRTYDDFMERFNRTCLSIAGKAQRNKRCSQNGL